MLKTLSFLFLLSLCFGCNSSENTSIDLNTQSWIHGSNDCTTNTDPSIQVVQYNKNTWILRQNKCLNYEAPFMFLFIGEQKALLMDTGATKDTQQFPLYETVNSLIESWQTKHHKTIEELIVAHTHAHGDHYAADYQFKGKEKVTVVDLNYEAVASFFKIKNWPENVSHFDLGNRTLSIIPIPGHQDASIAIYDPETQFLLTGDTVYPGRLYVEDWNTFKRSIETLVSFTQEHSISYILGNHIEMSTTPSIDYPIRTIYQPNELPLPLTVENLKELYTTLNTLGDTPTRKVLDKLIIYPVGQ